jgi:hypothetical protein
MNANIPLILTAVVTISTIIYTFYSIQLWRATRAAAEISRQAAFSNLWAELNRYLEIMRQQNAPETPFLQELSNLLLEFMIGSLINNALDKKDEQMEAFRCKVAALIGKHETHALNIPWVTSMAKWGGASKREPA